MIQQDLILKPNFLKIGWRLLNSQFLVSWTFILYSFACYIYFNDDIIITKVDNNKWGKNRKENSLIEKLRKDFRLFLKSWENFVNV